MNPLADELLQLAWKLVNLDEDPATSRRAVSTAYYAFFHLLIAEATLNWGRAEHRSQLSRLFDHGNMRRASDKICSDFNRLLKKKSPPPLISQASRDLKTVAEAFGTIQQKRIEADYVISSTWANADAVILVQLVSDTFTTWRSIREQPEAQAYLVNMFGNARL